MLTVADRALLEKRNGRLAGAFGPATKTGYLKWVAPGRGEQRMINGKLVKAEPA